MSKSDDVIAYLTILGVRDEMNTFVGRKKVQKIVYLLRQFGADLKFGYNWYLHGPYSPELTKTLMEDGFQNQSVRKLTNKEMEIVNETRNFLVQDFYSVDSLELIASLIYLIKHAEEIGLQSEDALIEFLINKKPQFSRREVEAAWEKIQDFGKWEKYMECLR